MPLDDLVAALDAAPAPVTLWWRDDDAGRDDPRLARLLDLARGMAAPVALAVVPAWLEPACAARIAGCPEAAILQHGHAHENHAAAGRKKIELGGAVDRTTLSARLVEGRNTLAAVLGRRFLPVLVPPWNRIDPDLLPRLAGMGWVGLSTFGPVPAAVPQGLRQVNAHLDLIRWREGRRPLTLGEAAAELARLVRAGPDRPVGLLSHHLCCDDEAFRTLDRLLRVVQDHPRTRLATAAELFRGAG